MIFRELRYILRRVGCLLLPIFGLVSCIYDNLPDFEDPIDTNGFSLGITISLDDGDGSQTRALSDDFGTDPIDNYIDTRNKFRVLFFDANGQFIFEAVDRTVMERTINNNKEWYVHIPVNYIVDYDGTPYDVELLKDQLKNADFKVAILANWPGSDPVWGYDESIYGSNTKNINDLHHLSEDSIYSREDNDSHGSNSDRPNSFEVYGFLMDGKKMGVKSDWVKYIEEIGDAENYIKTNWDPETPDAKQFSFGYYRNMWYLWSFSAAHESSGLRFSEDIVTSGGDNAKGWAWVRKNHYKASSDSRIQRSENSDFYNFVQGMGEYGKPRYFLDNSDDANLYINLDEYPGSSLEDHSAWATQGNRDYKQGWKACDTYCLRLPNIGTQNDKSKDPIGVRFWATASGTLRVRCACSSSSGTVRLAIYSPSNATSSSISEVAGITPVDITRSISITGDPVEYYIYCDRANGSQTSTAASADIYEIEYIKSNYLNNTNRERILPSEDNPIPMYGVQNFAKLENWEPGSVFDLSHSRKENNNNTEYDRKSIALIRSLAKVVVYLPANGGAAPTHVYMRSMNRTARCEPMDVETPTENLWLSHSNNSSSQQGCEWFRIRDYGPFYYEAYDNSGNTLGKNDNGSTVETVTYQKKLAWFYGSWMNAKWKNGNTGWTFKGADGNEIKPSASIAYPRLFNPSIDRSDFVRMAPEDNQAQGVYKYVLYVPDKNIDDPNYVGVSRSITKVAHIEYRYDGTAKNVDDNECYRIYFTDYSNNNVIGSVKKGDFDNDYELSNSNLKMHWPIMRNHVYTFRVTGALTRGGEGAQMVTSSVTTWNGASVLPE